MERRDEGHHFTDKSDDMGIVAEKIAKDLPRLVNEAQTDCDPINARLWRPSV